MLGLIAASSTCTANQRLDIVNCEYQTKSPCTQQYCNSRISGLFRGIVGGVVGTVVGGVIMGVPGTTLGAH